MKKTLLFLLLSFCIHAVQAEDTVSVMTFNIRYENSSDSLNAWSHRKENVGAMLRYYEPDILGMQEVLHNQLENIRAMLPQYDFVGVGRADGKEDGEYSPIFYKKEKYLLFRSGTFGLSEQPDQIGLKGWDAACERIVTWAILRDRESEQEIAVFNTHFDHIGQVARRESSKLLLNLIEELAVGDRPVIVTGDFNGVQNSESIRLLTEGGLIDSRSVSPIVYGPSYSFHDFGRLEEAQRDIIDYIFVKGNVKVDKYRIIDDSSCGYLSDHNPIILMVRVKSSRIPLMRFVMFPSHQHS